jgi:hypothetical protein
MADGFNRLSLESLKTVEGVNELNRMLDLLFRLVGGDGEDQRVYSGYGVPTIPATSGSVFLRKDGGANTSVYVKEGAAWAAK